jgi:hypothetical protein
MTGLSRCATTEFIVTANATTILRSSQRCGFVAHAELPGDAVRFSQDTKLISAGPWLVLGNFSNHRF